MFLSTFPPCSNRPLLLSLWVISGVSLLGLSSVLAQTASQEYTQGVQALGNGDVEGARSKLQLALEIDPQFRPANVLLARIAAAQKPGASSPGLSEKTLEQTLISVEFSDTTLNSAIEYLRQRVAQDSGGKQQINFAVNLPPDLANKRVTLKLDHVPLSEVLRYLGDMAGVKFERQPYAIAVMPAGVSSASSTAQPLPAATPRS